jgi:hypothetical protein
VHTFTPYSAHIQPLQCTHSTPTVHTFNPYSCCYFGTQLLLLWHSAVVTLALSCCYFAGAAPPLKDPITASIGIWNGSQFVGVEKALFAHLLSDLKGAVEETAFLAALDANYAIRELRPAFKTVTAASLSMLANCHSCFGVTDALLLCPSIICLSLLPPAHHLPLTVATRSYPSKSAQNFL